MWVVCASDSFDENRAFLIVFTTCDSVESSDTNDVFYMIILPLLRCAHARHTMLTPDMLPGALSAVPGMGTLRGVS